MQLALQTLGAMSPHPADEAFQVLASYWQWMVGKREPGCPLSAQEDLVSLCCLWLAVEHGKQLSRQAIRLAEQNHRIGSQHHGSWLDALSWALCLSAKERDPEDGPGMDVAIANLNHHQATTRETIHHLIWVVLPWLEGGYLDVRLTACIIEILSPESAAGLWAKKYMGLDSLRVDLDPVEIDRLHRIRSKDSLFQDIEYYRTKGLQLFTERALSYRQGSTVRLQAHFHKREAQCRSLIMQVLMKGDRITLPSYEELSDW
ncbi:MAG: hypothetical protein KDC10_16365 [Calditrichaeota bacterium]|nr:hypothetical protein [Calditrichota bacterium]